MEKDQNKKDNNIDHIPSVGKKSNDLKSKYEKKPKSSVEQDDRIKELSEAKKEKNIRLNNWRSGEKSLRDRIFGGKKKKKLKKKRARIEFEIYFIILISFIFFSNLLPMVLGWVYYWYVIHPLFRRIAMDVVPDNTSLVGYEFRYAEIFWSNTSNTLSDPINFMILFTAPLVIIALYLLRQFLCAFVGKIMYSFFNWLRPKKELNRARFDGLEADDVNIYHSRNFLLRLLKWQFHKSPFPWMLPWMFNYIGANKIGKNVVFEEGLMTLEFLEVADNVYFAPMVATTSHVVEGTYGSLSIKTIKLGENAVVGARTCVGPGVEIGDECQILMFGGITKLIKVPAGSDQFGAPSGRISHSKYIKVLNMPEEIQKIDKELMMERKRKIKKNRKSKIEE